MYSSYINAAYDVPILKNNIQLISITNLLKLNPYIMYQKCHEAMEYNLLPLPVSVWPSQHPHQGKFAETFILTIPQGSVYSEYGNIIIDEKYMLKEFILPNYRFHHTLNLINETPQAHKRKVSGKVAVITRRDAGTYGHWIIDLLGRIALLEIMGIDFDWLYIPYDKPFMKETLELWGIDSSKIIEPKNEFYHIQADELVVPSLVSKRIPLPNQTFSNYTPLAVYYPLWAVDYIRNKYLPLVTNNPNLNFSQKIFISRKDSNYRRVDNEDEVFQEFEKYGFVRYELSKLSFLDQLRLFYHAKIIVSPNGSGLSNIMFCSKDAKIIEIFQARADSSFYNLAQVIGLDYSCIFTSEFHEIGFCNTRVPIEIIQNFVKTYLFSECN